MRLSSDTKGIFTQNANISETLVTTHCSNVAMFSAFFSSVLVFSVLIVLELIYEHGNIHRTLKSDLSLCLLPFKIQDLLILTLSVKNTIVLNVAKFDMPACSSG